EGPAVSLQPATAQSLALALHELVTNAVKHGALSMPQGRVSLTWELKREDLTIRWIESGGPPVKPPSRKGFGTKVINASIEHQLRGRAIFEGHAEGLHCSLPFPASNLARSSPVFDPYYKIEQVPEMGPQMPINGRRILLVEDEALVGIMMKDTLND